jgi:hypothetical protein
MSGGPADAAAASKRLRESGFQELSQFRRRLKLGNRFQPFERGSEGIREAPNRSGTELVVLWLEVQVMNRAGQVFRCFQPALDESLIDYNLGSHIAKFEFLPSLDLFSHGVEIPLHPIDTDRNAINE